MLHYTVNEVQKSSTNTASHTHPWHSWWLSPSPASCLWASASERCRRSCWLPWAACCAAPATSPATRTPRSEHRAGIWLRGGEEERYMHMHMHMNLYTWTILLLETVSGSYMQQIKTKWLLHDHVTCICVYSSYYVHVYMYVCIQCKRHLHCTCGMATLYNVHTWLFNRIEVTLEEGKRLREVVSWWVEHLCCQELSRDAG